MSGRVILPDCGHLKEAPVPFPPDCFWAFWVIVSLVCFGFLELYGFEMKCGTLGVSNVQNVPLFPTFEGFVLLF